MAQFCHARGGRVEVSLPHGGRVACITEKYAIEGDFAPKWKEVVSQSKKYAQAADKQAGILLILENENDKVYIEKLCDLIAKEQVPIDVFAIGHGVVEQGKDVSCETSKQWLITL